MSALLVVLIVAAALWLVMFAVALLLNYGDFAGAALVASQIVGFVAFILIVVAVAAWLISLVVAA